MVKKVMVCIIGWLSMLSPLPGEASEPSDQMISVGSHRLHVRIAGEGAPTVIIDSGLGDTSERLQGLQEHLARTTRVITYDRAGYGPSEPGPLPRDSGREADELKALLDGASISGPYVVVGHSLGAVNVQVFAAKYPEDVVGIVLLDPPPLTFVRGEEFTSLLDMAERMTAEWQAIADSGAGSTDAQERANAEFFAMIASEHRELFGGKSARLVSEISSFGRTPLLVMAAGVPNPAFGDVAGDFQEYWVEQSRQLTDRSSNGQFVLAEESSHHLYEDDLDLVVEAILSIVTQARSDHSSLTGQPTTTS
jgi:pimeloyl-ACP methyl ester carboxylesterase